MVVETDEVSPLLFLLLGSKGPGRGRRAAAGLGNRKSAAGSHGYRTALTARCKPQKEAITLSLNTQKEKSHVKVHTDCKDRGCYASFVFTHNSGASVYCIPLSCLDVPCSCAPSVGEHCLCAFSLFPE